MAGDAQTLTARCVAEVLRRGEATVSQVLGSVSRHLSAAAAVQRGRALVARRGRRRRPNGGRKAAPENPIYDAPHLADLGRREAVRAALEKAASRGLVRRTAPGVYAATLPKLFDAGAARVG